ncbi:MAG: DUF3105 domain-containing protein [Chloroflexi bacterium]|nr:DUF3105 domain-containing protein [Chloroflexota bacterium]
MAGSREQGGQARQTAQERRQQRLEVRQRTASVQRRNRLLLIGGVGLAALVVVGLLGYAAFAEITKERPGQAIEDLGNAHIGSADTPHIPYNSVPPTSGPHIGGGVASRGIKTTQVPNELQVHNLEDAFVIVHYDCPEGCPELVEQLTSVVQTYLDRNKKLILEPYAGLSNRIGLTAWTRLDSFDEFDAERIRKFIDAYEGIDHHVRAGRSLSGS